MSHRLEIWVLPVKNFVRNQKKKKRCFFLFCLSLWFCHSTLVRSLLKHARLLLNQSGSASQSKEDVWHVPSCSWLNPYPETLPIRLRSLCSAGSGNLSSSQYLRSRTALFPWGKRFQTLEAEVHKKKKEKLQKWEVLIWGFDEFCISSVISCACLPTARMKMFWKEILGNIITVTKFDAGRERGGWIF